MKKNALKLIVCLTLILVSVLFTGCSSVNYVNYTDENGVYTEAVEITIDSTKFQNVEHAKQDISDAVNSELLEKYTAYTFSITSKMNEIANDPEKQELYNLYEDILDDITWKQEGFENDNYFYIKIMFESKTSYLLFYNLNEKNFSEKEIQKGLLYNKITYKGHLGYYVQNSLYNTLKNSVYLHKYSFIFNETDVNLTYSYLVGSSRYKSNADKVFYVGDGLHSHTWNVDLNNMDKEIYFTLTLANRWIWYLTAIAISLIICIIISLIYLIKHFKSKKNKEKIL